MDEWINLTDNQFLQIRIVNDDSRVEIKREDGKIVNVEGSPSNCRDCFDSLRKMLAEWSNWLIALDEFDIAEALFKHDKKDLHYLSWSNVLDSRKGKYKNLQDASSSFKTFITGLRPEAESVFIWAYGDWNLCEFSEVINAMDILDHISVIVELIYMEDTTEKSLHALVV